MRPRYCKEPSCPKTATSGVVVTPAVVYLRDGEPSELVARMRDWPVFAQACDRLLAPTTDTDAQGIGGNA